MHTRQSLYRQRNEIASCSSPTEYHVLDQILAHEMRDCLDYVRNSLRYKSDYIGMVFDEVEISAKLF